MHLWLARLAEGRRRALVARWLLGGCVVGFFLTLGAMQLAGWGLDRWIFALIVWGALVFLPLRIALDASGSLGARALAALRRRLASHPSRYDHPEWLPVLVGDLFARRVTMPRITTPAHARKAHDAAAAILRHLVGRTDAGDRLGGAIRLALAAAAAEAMHVSALASGPTAQSIQARWDGARALGTLAALIQLLTAAFADRWDRPPPVPELAGRSLRDFLDATLDYCDEAALQVDALPWTEPPLPALLAPETVDRVRGAWRVFVAAPPPATAALDAFVGEVLRPPA
ncbi:MAG: hypothetical protein QN183_04370 [Armatimonadota bacterium]|nr:hypothetical protein [Armatimonadota bacterium]MDR7486392.1 hypothetical protein [Armatimonadota bacterium]MDR7532524.1 hypothetical protein [Armatimonadota bacterium]MDR7535586.1 hypothetical protein [Armatimonadota bacterium]